MAKIALIGVGQTIRGDNAAGLEAVRLWQLQYPHTAQKLQVELFELPGLALLDRLEGMEAAILVDAVQIGAAPGTIQRLGPEELAAFSTEAQSAHGWGVAETLALGRSLNPELAKCRITLIGIVGSQFNLGSGLSTAVQAALSEAAGLIEMEIQSILDE